VITGHTKLAAVIGWPVEHSRSPQMMNAAFAAAGIDAVLVPIAAPPDALAGAIAGLRAHRGALGASVTLPHKVGVLALCDEIAPEAFAIGAVNCLHVVAGRVVGYNTDGVGFADALAERGLELAGRRAVVLGAGGAARAVVHGIRLAGAREVAVVARSTATWTQVAPWDSLAATVEGADLVVDCTPVALDPAAEPAFVDAIPLARLPPSAVVATLVYHRRAAILAAAASRGLRTLDGADMLVHQGARAFTRWTGEPAPISIMRAALARATESSS
jgi:shikimate dehydrogenase